MFVNQLAIETGMAFEILADPEWQRIAAAIGGLDGVEHTMVSLGSGGPACMTIGGGPDRCVVHATGDGRTFFTLIQPSESGTSVGLVVCQLAAQFPGESAIAKAAALKAAEFFAENGELDPGFYWQQSDTREEEPE